jgi:hypothetical protein
MMPPRTLLLLAALAMTPAFAAETTSTTERRREPAFVATEAFLSGHPDLRWRIAGLNAHRKGEYREALEAFRRAARFADKPAAAAIAELYWEGKGVAQDRALAYAWMDLAAERQWRLFLVRREGMWAELTDAERERALVVGTALYEEFGDAVAKPRMARVLRNARRNTTGSRTGSVGSLRIEIPSANGSLIVDGSQFYADKYWDPKMYWRWQQETWAPELQGRVDVGTVTAAAEAPGDRKPATDTQPGDR